MSETIAPEAAAPGEPAYRDSVVKSDVIAPNALGPAGETAEPEASAESPKAEEKPAEAKPEPKREDPLQARIRQLSARTAAEAKRAEAAERERDELRARLAAPPAGESPAQPPAAKSPAELERIIEERAAQLAERNAFNADCNRVALKGAEEYGAEFQPTVQALWGLLDGDAPNTLIEAALETDKPEAVLYHLGKNPAEAVRIATLKPAKMGAAVAKIASALATAAASKPAVSRAPAPIETVAGAVRAEPGTMGPKNMADWIKWEEERTAKARGR